MDLRRRTTQVLAGAGSFLIVTGLSLGGGVAVASSGPATSSSLGSAKVTTASSGKKPGKTGSKDDRKARRSTSTTAGTDPSSTATSAATAPSATTATTGSTATSVPSTTATTAAPSTTSPPTTAQPAPAGFTGQYNGGQPYQATEAPEDGSSTSTAPAGRTAGATKPASRSGSGLPPGIYPADPGSKTADSPAPATASAPTPLTPVVPLPTPVAPAEAVPGGETTTSSVAPAAADAPGSADAPGTEVRSANQTSEESPAAVRSRQLGQTGDGTRRLIILGGIVLLVGALVVAFAGREHPMLLAAPALPPGPARRQPRPRREIDGWEDGIPLAPVKRELARHRLGISGDPYDSYSDGEPGA